MSGMSVKLRKGLKVLVVVLVVWLCVSCDRGTPISLSGHNFAWSQRSTDPLNIYVDSYYWSRGKEGWAVLRWKGSGQMGGEEQIVLLCLSEMSCCCVTRYRLDHGLVISTWGVTSDRDVRGEVNRLRVLKERFFEAESRSGKLLLTYNGEVSGNSNYDEGTDMTWLRFQVKATRQRDRVVNNTLKVLPLLKREEDGQGIMGCIGSLFNEGSS